MKKNMRKKVISIALIAALILSLGAPIVSMAGDPVQKDIDINSKTDVIEKKVSEDVKTDGNDSTESAPQDNKQDQTNNQDKVKGKSSDLDYTFDAVTPESVPEYYAETSTEGLYKYRLKSGKTLYRVYGKLNEANTAHWYNADDEGILIKPYDLLDQGEEQNNAYNTGGQGSTIGGKLESDKARIDSLKIKSVVDGTKPWDSNDEPGNDSGATNGTVRTFDQLYYTLTYSTMLQNQEETVYYTSGDMYVRFVLPNVTFKEAKFDIESMPWLIGGKQVEENGNIILTGKRTITPENPNTPVIPGEGELSAVIKVLGMANGSTLTPSFTAWMEGNSEDEDEYKTVVGDDINVSAAPSYNVQLKTNGNYKDTFNFNDNKNAPNYGAGNVTGRMYFYGITLQLMNEDQNKKLKGIELPKGEITLDINLNVMENGIDVTGSGEDEVMPLLWEYKPNDIGLTGNHNRNMAWTSSDDGIAAFYSPLNSGGGPRGATNGGNWNMTQNSETISITVDSYEFLNASKEYHWPTGNPGSLKNAAGEDHYGVDKGIGCFSSGYFQVLVPFPQEIKGTLDWKFTVSDQNLMAESLTNQKLPQSKTNENQILKSDDSVKVDVVFTKKGNYSKFTMQCDKDVKFYPYVPNADAYTMQGDEFYLIASYVARGNDGDTMGYAINLLQKFDDKAFQPLDDAGKKSYKLFIEGFGDIDYELRYAAKPDGTGWGNSEIEADAAMNEAKEDDLIYFNSMAELKSHFASINPDAVCVAVLVEGRNGRSHDVGYIGFKVKVAKDIEPGYVAQTTNRLKIWNKAVGEKMDFNDSVLSKEQDVKDLIKNPSYTLDGSSYNKTQYDKYGQITDESHTPGGHWTGASFLIIGEKASITKSVTQKSGNDPKNTYELSAGERKVDYILKPKLSSTKVGEVAELPSDVTIIDTLPKDLSVVGTKYMWGDQEITPEDGYPQVDSSTGETTIKFILEDVIAGKSIDPITFTANIGNPGAPDDVGAEIQQFTNKVTINSTRDMRVPNGTFGNLAKYTISTFKLGTSSFYKMINTPKREVNETMEYTISYNNTGGRSIDNLALLDVLPYNGDGRGTKIGDSTYTTKVKVDLTNAKNSTNMTLMSTDSEGVRGKNVSQVSSTDFTSKGTVAGGSSEEFEIGDATAFYLAGVLDDKDKYDITITLTPSNNAGGYIYGNDSTSTIDTSGDYLYAPQVSGVVVKRDIAGTAWLDMNKDGIMDSDEMKLKGVKASLFTSTGQPAEDVRGNEVSAVTTGDDGKYLFEDLKEGTYQVVFESNDDSKVFDISKFDITTKEAVPTKSLNSNATGSYSSSVLTKGTVADVALPGIDDVTVYGYINNHNNAGFIANPTSLDLSGTKNLTGRNIKDGEFKFNVTNEADELLTTGVAMKNGTIDFAKSISFDRVGTFKLKVYEDTSDGLGGVTYDNALYTVTVKVKYVDGELNIAAKDVTYEKTVSGDTEAVSSAAGITFNNKYSADAVTYAAVATKAIEGDTPTADRVFTFKLTGLNDAPMPGGSVNSVKETTVAGIGTASFGDMTFTEAGTYEYKVSEVDSKVPGYIYDDSEYTLTIVVTDPEDGKLKIDSVKVDGEASKDLKFTNIYAAPIETTLEATKTLSGRDLKDEEFKFQVADKDGQVVSNGTNDEDGNITFDKPIVFDGVGQFTYEVSELSSDIPKGVTYDSRIFTVTYTVEYDDDNKLEITNTAYRVKDSSDKTEDITFQNIYKPGAVDFDPEVTKTITGDAFAVDTSFIFALEGAKEGQPMPVESYGNKKNVIINGAGKANFGKITFTEAGTYNYTVSEQKGDSKWYTYDDTKYNLEITVIDNKNGDLEIKSVLVDSEEDKDMTFENVYRAPVPGMILEKTANKETVAVNEKITYSIKVTNTGEKDLKNVVIKDPIPTGTVFESANSGGVYMKEGDTKIVKWTIDNLKIGESKTVKFTVTVVDSVINSVITNTATGSSDETPEVKGDESIPVGGVMGEGADPTPSNEVATVLGQEAKTSDAMTLGLLIALLIVAGAGAFVLIRKRSKTN